MTPFSEQPHEIPRAALQDNLIETQRENAALRARIVKLEASVHNKDAEFLKVTLDQQTHIEKLEAVLSEFANMENWDGDMWSPIRHSGMDYPVDFAREALEVDA